jgi:hypothetical protein
MCRAAHDVGRVARRAYKDFGYVTLTSRAFVIQLRHVGRLLGDDRSRIVPEHAHIAREMDPRFARVPHHTARADASSLGPYAGLYWPRRSRSAPAMELERFHDRFGVE